METFGSALHRQYGRRVASRIVTAYLCFLSICMGITVVCWIAAKSENDSIAQSQSQEEQDITIQKLQDKVIQHDLQLAANDATISKLWEKLTAVEMSLTELKTRFDGMMTVAWGFIIPLALIALKEVLQAVVFLRDRKDPESRTYRKDMFG